MGGDALVGRGCQPGELEESMLSHHEVGLQHVTHHNSHPYHIDFKMGMKDMTTMTGGIQTIGITIDMRQVIVKVSLRLPWQ